MITTIEYTHKFQSESFQLNIFIKKRIKPLSRIAAKKFMYIIDRRFNSWPDIRNDRQTEENFELKTNDIDSNCNMIYEWLMRVETGLKDKGKMLSNLLII